MYKWETGIHQSMPKYLLVVPEVLKKKVLEACHDSVTGGHLGVSKTKERIKQRFMWPGLKKDCYVYVMGCANCNRNKGSTVKPKQGLGEYHVGDVLESTYGYCRPISDY